MEQAPEDPAEGFGKKEVDRVPAKSPIENIPLDQTSDPIRSKPKKLVLILREDNVGDLANSLQMFAPKGSTVTVVSKEKPEVSQTAAHAPSLLLLHVVLSSGKTSAEQADEQLAVSALGVHL